MAEALLDSNNDNLQPLLHKPFEYEPLESVPDSIRLLKVDLFDEESEMIRCSLRQATISGTRYYALSYVWSESDKAKHVSRQDLTSNQSPDERHDHQFRIIVNEQYYLTVFPNLWRFLKKASEMLSDVSLWIDAICINQGNVLEKNEQVRRMGKVYKGARKVIAWLGEGSSTVQELFWYLESIVDRYNLELPSLEDRRLLLYGLDTIHYNPYWTRLWIIQEILNASTIDLMFGGSRISWQTFWNGVDLLNRLWRAQDEYTTHQIGLPATRIMRQRATHVAPGAHHIDELLNLCEFSRCDEVRDRVFALLSLLDGGENFEVDYRDSTTKLALRACAFFTIRGDDTSRESSAVYQHHAVDLLKRLEETLAVGSRWRLAELKASSEIYLPIKLRTWENLQTGSMPPKTRYVLFDVVHARSHSSETQQSLQIETDRECNPLIRLTCPQCTQVFPRLLVCDGRDATCCLCELGLKGALNFTYTTWEGNEVCSAIWLNYYRCPRSFPLSIHLCDLSRTRKIYMLVEDFRRARLCISARVFKLLVAQIRVADFWKENLPYLLTFLADKPDVRHARVFC